MANSVVQNENADWAYGAYVNYPDDRLQSCELFASLKQLSVNGCIGQRLIYGDHYQKLTELKSLYDPENVFSYPHSVERS